MAELNREDLFDIISDALGDSMDMDWTYGTGARYVLDALVKEGIVKLETADDLLAQLTIIGLPDSARLVVMTQNPADYHHWSKSVGGFTAGQVRAAIAQPEAA